MKTMAETVRDGLRAMLQENDNAVVCGQLVRWGTAGITEGLYEEFPDRVLTFPVAESLMNSAAFGLALHGTRVVMVHERIDFIACGMDALVNHIPIWPAKCGISLPLTILAIVGKGKGQGPQHSKNLTNWFREFEGWTVREPRSALRASIAIDECTHNALPHFLTLHREDFRLRGDETVPFSTVINRGIIQLRGANQD